MYYLWEEEDLVDEAHPTTRPQDVIRESKRVNASINCGISVDIYNNSCEQFERKFITFMCSVLQRYHGSHRERESYSRQRYYLEQIKVSQNDIISNIEYS
ncbi:tRNA wybutosine-synthesizing protein [Dirofilaria immitis]